MTFTIEMYEVLDKLVEDIKGSKEFIAYLESYKSYKNNMQLLQLSDSLYSIMKEIEVLEYKNNTIEYFEKMKKFTKMKKKFDTDDAIINLRRNEKRLQTLLDSITENICDCFSNNVNIIKTNDVIINSNKCALCDCKIFNNTMKLGE